MLNLPDAWQDWHAGAVTKHLFGQVDSARLQIAMARHLIWTHFDVLHMTIWRRNKSGTRVTESPRRVWKVNDATFVYVPVVDDAILNPRLRRGRGPMDRLIVPCEQGGIVRYALEKALDGKFVNVSSIDELVSFRQMMTTLDTGWGSARTAWVILRRYNWRARRAGESDEIQVSLPSAAAVPRYQPRGWRDPHEQVRANSRLRCRRCGQRYESCGDDYNGFCPECADHLFSRLCETCGQPIAYEADQFHHVTEDGEIDGNSDAEHSPVNTEDD